MPAWVRRHELRRKEVLGFNPRGFLSTLIHFNEVGGLTDSESTVFHFQRQGGLHMDDQELCTWG